MTPPPREAEVVALEVKLGYLKSIRTFTGYVNRLTRLVLVIESRDRLIENEEKQELDWGASRQRYLKEAVKLASRVRRTAKHAISAAEWVDSDSGMITELVESTTVFAKAPASYLNTWFRHHGRLDFAEEKIRHSPPRIGKGKKLHHPTLPTIGKAIRYLNSSGDLIPDVDRRIHLSEAGHRNIRRTVKHADSIYQRIAELANFVKTQTFELGASNSHVETKRLVTEIEPRSLDGWQQGIPFVDPTTFEIYDSRPFECITEVPIAQILSTDHSHQMTGRRRVCLTWRAYQSIWSSCNLSRFLFDMPTHQLGLESLASLEASWKVTHQRLADALKLATAEKLRLEIRGLWNVRDIYALHLIGDASLRHNLEDRLVEDVDAGGPARSESQTYPPPVFCREAELDDVESKLENKAVKLFRVLRTSKFFQSYDDVLDAYNPDIQHRSLSRAIERLGDQLATKGYAEWMIRNEGSPNWRVRLYHCIHEADVSK